MSYARIIKAQNGLQLVTEQGNMDLNPAGDLSLKGFVKGTDIAVHNADVATIAGLSPGASEDGKVLSWNDTGSTYELVADSSNSYTAGDGLDVAANEFSLSASVAGDGLSHASGVLSVGVDDSTVELDSDALRVKDAGITGAKLAGDCIVRGCVLRFIHACVEHRQGYTYIPKFRMGDARGLRKYTTKLNNNAENTTKI